MKLLVVDDDADMLAVVSFALRQASFPVVTANSYGTGLSTFHTEQPDLAILDINLPGGSGFELCGVLRKESNAPIMMLTARGEEADLVRALELGADDYLTKPFSPRTLVARVKALLRRAGQESGSPDARRRARARPGSAAAAHRRARDQASRRWSRGCCSCCWPTPARWCTPTGCWCTSGGTAAAAIASCSSSWSIGCDRRSAMIPSSPAGSAPSRASATCCA